MRSRTYQDCRDYQDAVPVGSNEIETAPACACPLAPARVPTRLYACTPVRARLRPSACAPVRVPGCVCVRPCVCLRVRACVCVPTGERVRSFV